MFSFRKQKRAVAPSRVRLDLQALGDRLVPSAPQITGFTSTYVSPGQWMLSGTVSDDNPVEGLAVILDGPGDIQGVKAEVGANGWFNVIVDVNASGSVVGTVEDWDCNISDPVYTNVYA